MSERDLIWQRRRDLIRRNQEITRKGHINYRWYVKENDVIGGWCVMPIDEPPSWGISAVANFISKDCAQHVTNLHNEWRELEEYNAHI